MQKDDGNPSGGERRPESGELLADSGKKEAQARRPRRGTRRTDGPLGKHESKNTKKMIAAQAIDPAKDIAASRERMAREDERAKRAAEARVDAGAGAAGGLHDFLSRLIHQLMIVPLDANADFFFDCH